MTELEQLSQNMCNLLDELKGQLNLVVAHEVKSSELLVKIYNQGKEDGLSKDRIRGLVVLTLKTVKGLKDRQIRNLLPLELKYTEFSNKEKVGGNITASFNEQNEWLSRVCMYGRIVACQRSGDGSHICFLCWADENDYPGILKTVKPIYSNQEIAHHVMFDHGIIFHGWSEYEELPPCSYAHSPNGCRCVVNNFQTIPYESCTIKISDIKKGVATN